MRQARDVFAVNFDEGQRVRLLGVDCGVSGLDQRALAGAARAPQQHVVGGEAGGKATGVFEQNVAHPVDAAQQADLDAVDLRDRFEPTGIGMPDKGVGGVEIGGWRRRRRQAFEGGGDPLQERQQIGIGFGHRYSSRP